MDTTHEHCLSPLSSILQRGFPWNSLGSRPPRCYRRRCGAADGAICLGRPERESRRCAADGDSRRQDLL